MGYQRFIGVKLDIWHGDKIQVQRVKGQGIKGKAKENFKLSRLKFATKQCPPIFDPPFGNHLSAQPPQRGGGPNTTKKPTATDTPRRRKTHTTRIKKQNRHTPFQHKNIKHIAVI